MKLRLLSVLAITSLLFASCSSDDEAAVPNNGAVQFSAGVNQATAPGTRAANSSWAANDAIGVFMVNKGSTTIAENAINKKHTTTNGTSFAPVAGSEIYYPVSGAAVDFIAYYPYMGSITILGNYAVNVSDQSSQPAIDLLWSKANNSGNGYSKTSGNVPLVFDHQLSKLIINTTAGDGLKAADLVGMTVTIKGMNTKADFDLASGVLGASSVKANIVPYTTNNGVQYEAIVLPAAFATGELSMTFKIGNDTFTWKSPTADDGKFEAGKEYTYTMTISRAEVGFNCTIKSWDTVSRTGAAN